MAPQIDTVGSLLINCFEITEINPCLQNITPLISGVVVMVLRQTVTDPLQYQVKRRSQSVGLDPDGCKKEPAVLAWMFGLGIVKQYDL